MKKTTKTEAAGAETSAKLDAAADMLALNQAREVWGPLEEKPALALAAYALGAGDGDVVDGLLCEIAARLAIIRAALAGDPGMASDTRLADELHMLERRAEVARVLVQRAKPKG